VIPIKNIYYLLSYAWGKLDESHDTMVKLGDFDNAFDLLSRLLISSTSYLVKKGLSQEYIEKTSPIRGIKGKFLIGATLKKNLLVSSKAICQYDEYSPNTKTNQIIKYTLLKVLRSEMLNKKHKIAIKNLVFRFQDIDQRVFSLSEIRSHSLNRITLHYKPTIQICQFILENLVPSESNNGSYIFKDFTRDEKKMAYLFEGFLRNFYKEHSGYDMVWSEILKWHETSTTINRTSLPNMYTDISMQTDNAKIIIDAKYYAEALQGNKKETIRSNNLYQLFTYLRTDFLVRNKRSRGILIYPTTNLHLQESYEIDGFSISIATVNLNQDWSGIHSRLLSIINDNGR